MYTVFNYNHPVIRYYILWEIGASYKKEKEVMCKRIAGYGSSIRNPGDVSLIQDVAEYLGQDLKTAGNEFYPKEQSN
jgi:hypothetical protein